MKDKFLIKKTKIRIIGIGGGGGSIVAELSKRLNKASFLVANTDNRALKIMPRKVSRFKFGQELTHSLGTGMDPEVGRLAAENEKQRIKKILKSQDLCIFIICLGGGTGSGAGPIFTEISHHSGNINLGIFTMPFKFEGERRIQIARESLEKFKPHLNGFMVIPNQRIFKIIDKKSSLSQSFSAFNRILADNLTVLIELIYKPGLINIDFADFKTILEGKGDRIYFNTAEAKGPSRAEEVIKNVLNSPVFDFNTNNVKRILFNISAFPDLKMREVEQISSAFAALNKQSKIIFGVSEAPRGQKSDIKVALLITGSAKRKEVTKTKKTTESDEVISETKVSIKKPAKIKKAEVEPPRVKKSPSKENKKRKEEMKKNLKRKTIKKKKIKNKKTKQTEIKVIFKSKSKKKREKRRLNAMEVKKAAEKEEKKRWVEEEKWDVPAFLRRSPWREKIKGFRQKK